ncbi:hypothetical protein PENTCL1PPCAC_24312, partial [Pristionchus entomophagus]
WIRLILHFSIMAIFDIFWIAYTYTGIPAIEQAIQLKNHIVILSLIIPLINVGNFVFQCLGGSTTALRIETFLLLSLALAFLICLVLSKKVFNIGSSVTLLVFCFLTISLLIVIIIHTGLTLYTLISTGQDIWMAPVVLLVFTIIELGVRVYITKMCWTVYELVSNPGGVLAPTNVIENPK